MKKLSIQVNMVSEVRKLREDTYGTYSFIYEMIQNGQRAKATEIQVTHDYEKIITISDNGCGCSNLQNLFTKSDSGWSTDVRESDNPFGEGFFSTFAIADQLVIESLDRVCTVDIKGMIESGNLDMIAELKNTEHVAGFRVKIQLRSDIDFSFSNFHTHLRAVAKFIQPDVYLNGSIIDKEEFIPSDLQWALPINEKGVHGFVAPTRFGSVDTFNQDRFVCKFLWGAEGRVKVDGFKGLKFRSPDRTEILYNSAKGALSEFLRGKVATMYENIVIAGTDEDIEIYQDTIADNVSAERLREIVMVSELSTFREEHQKSLGVHSEDDSTSPVDHGHVESSMNEAMNAMAQVADLQHVIRSSDYSKTTSFGPKKQEKKGRKTGSKITKGFWVKTSELEDYDDLLAKLQYHNIKVYVAKNKVQIKALSHLSHVSKVNDEIQMHAEVKRLSTNKKTLNKVLAWVEKLFELEAGTIQYGNIKFFKVIDGVEVEENVEAFTDGNKIYLSKDAVDSFTFNSFGNQALQWLVESSIPHELAHRLEGTTDETSRHFKVENEIIKKITRAYLVK